jgi:hypothetical protein
MDLTRPTAAVAAKPAQSVLPQNEVRNDIRNEGANEGDSFVV